MEDLHKYWGHMWVNPKIEQRPSPVHGQGSFAKERIDKDEVITVNGGLVVPVADVEKLRSELGSMRGLQIHDDFLITMPTPSEAMFNHSCEPNLGLSGPVITVAIRDIEADEEVLYCYYFSETNFHPFTCTCGSPQCRKTVAPTGWNDDKEFQKQYAAYFSPYLQKKFIQE